MKFPRQCSIHSSCVFSKLQTYKYVTAQRISRSLISSFLSLTAGSRPRPTWASLVQGVTTIHRWIVLCDSHHCSPLLSKSTQASQRIPSSCVPRGAFLFWECLERHWSWECLKKSKWFFFPSLDSPEPFPYHRSVYITSPAQLVYTPGGTVINGEPWQNYHNSFSFSSNIPLCSHKWCFWLWHRKENWNTAEMSESHREEDYTFLKTTVSVVQGCQMWHQTHNIWWASLFLRLVHHQCCLLTPALPVYVFVCLRWTEQ